MGWLGKALTIKEDPIVSDRDKVDVDKSYKLRRKDFWSGTRGAALVAAGKWIKKKGYLISVWSLEGDEYSASVIYKKVTDR